MGSPLGCLLGFFLAILVFIGVFLLTIVGKVKQIMNSFSPKHKAERNPPVSRVIRRTNRLILNKQTVQESLLLHIRKYLQMMKENM